MPRQRPCTNTMAASITDASNVSLGSDKNHAIAVPALYYTSSPTSVQLNKNQSVTLTATTTTIRRNDELVWGMLSKHSFQTMYVYSDLIESLVVGDVQANLLGMILPRGQPGEMVADEIKRPTYHRFLLGGNEYKKRHRSTDIICVWCCQNNITLSTKDNSVRCFYQ